MWHYLNLDQCCDVQIRHNYVAPCDNLEEIKTTAAILITGKKGHNVSRKGKLELLTTEIFNQDVTDLTGGCPHNFLVPSHTKIEQAQTSVPTLVE